jgi:hypothetical protein
MILYRHTETGAVLEIDDDAEVDAAVLKEQGFKAMTAKQAEKYEPAVLPPVEAREA